MKCKDDKTASSCKEGYYLKADGTCPSCPANSLCKAENVVDKCIDGFYKATAATCAACSSVETHSLYCSGTPTAGSDTNIT